ncbi:MAG: hypothetical protein GX318_07995 [Clostridia bacterium]|nr:hypothetical protein [Clostridia bacterium]
MKYMRPLLISMAIFLSLTLTGCTGTAQNYTTPPEDFTLDQVSRLIDLKSLELGRVTKRKVSKVHNISFSNFGQGYEINYRHLSQQISVQIIKFDSAKKGDQFWRVWTRGINVKNPGTENNCNVAAISSGKHSITAWQKNSWMTYIRVPSGIPNHSDLRDKVKDYVNYCYSKL